MFDFDEITENNIGSYTYTYPVKEIIEKAYRRTLNPNLAEDDNRFFAFTVAYVENEILRGHRKYHEFEQKWETLKFHIQEVEENFCKPEEEDRYPYMAELAGILLDQALLLLWEGNPIPNLK